MSNALVLEPSEVLRADPEARCRWPDMDLSNGAFDCLLLDEVHLNHHINSKISMKKEPTIVMHQESLC